MKSTEYLFGPNFDEQILEMQKVVAKYKIDRARKLLHSFLETKPLYKMTKEEDIRLNDILDAIDFWTKIYNEHPDKSINDVDFTANLDIIGTSSMTLDMPMTSEEFKERLRL